MTDAEARARALDPHTSFIVRAPAGSGKTELLIQRYLRLLSAVEAPESIVAITFTRKAAAEMRSRVLEALRGALGPAPDQTHKRITWELARAAMEQSAAAGWRLLENPARVRMQTIDSLCVAVTSQMPWVARFGAMPDIVEKAAPLYKEAARLTLIGPDRPDCVATLLLHLDNNFQRAQNLLAQMLEKRDQWLRHVCRPRVREHMELSLASIVEDAIRQLAEAASDAGLTRLPARDASALDAWKEVAGQLLTQKNEWRKKLPLAQTLTGNTRLLEAFIRVRELPPPQFAETQWRAMEAIVDLLPVAVGNLNAVFRERNAVDFIELALASLRALAHPEGPTELGLALGYRVHHILLDEFQDTSYTHYDLLKRLTLTWEPGDGRTVFLVGDPMQSIYRFRQAEVGLFLQTWREGLAREGLPNIALDRLTLSVNFRSGAGVVNWVNTAFADIFPAQEEVASGAVSYSPSSPAYSSEITSGPKATAAARVDVHPFMGEQGRALEAQRVAELAADARQHGTVGILVRARSHLPSIVTALRARGIRYQAIEIDELAERAVIQDLLALTFALLHPSDRISQLAVLRAPWCGLTLDALYHRTSDPRRARTEAILAQAVAERGQRGLRDLVEHTWMQLGGPACVESESELDDAAAYFDVLEGVEEGGDVSDFNLLRDQVRGLFAEPDIGADGRVQIMTIHKAKGLEFDAVLLPGLGAPPKKDDAQLILWHEPTQDELLFAPIPESGSDERHNDIYAYLRRIEQRKADFEAIRLLYVAATRARTTLHLLGCASARTDGTAYAPAGSFLKILWPVLEGHYAGLHATAPAAAETTAAGAFPVRRLPAEWTVPEPPPAVHWTRPWEVVSEPAPEIAYEWVGDTLRHVGTVVHAWLARIGREGLERWDAAAVRARAQAIRSMLKNHGMSGADLDAAVEQVITALQHAITGERGRWVLAGHEHAQCELALSGVVAGHVVEAVIDRTFVDGAHRWIIDYKTGAHAGGSVEQFLADEKRRYEEQLERYARLVAQGEDRPIRLALYYPLLEPGWVEWEARPMMRRQASLFAD